MRVGVEDAQSTQLELPVSGKGDEARQIIMLAKCTLTVSSSDRRQIQIVSGHRGRVMEGEKGNPDSAVGVPTALRLCFRVFPPASLPGQHRGVAHVVYRRQYPKFPHLGNGSQFGYLTVCPLPRPYAAM